MPNWETVAFGELYSIESRNGLMRPKRTRGAGFRMINMGEIFAYDRIGNIEMDRVPMNSSEQSLFAAREGDLLFARQSLVLEGAGKCAIVQETPELTTFESHLIRVRLNPALGDPQFYFYYFKSHSGRAVIAAITMQVAAAGIRGSELATIRVPYPPLKTQQRISFVLSTYDDLIENNARRIKILEQIAQMLYREWFVNFRFPGHEKVKMVESELGLIPEGWSVKKVEDVVGRIPSGKKFDQKTVAPTGSVPVFDQGKTGIIGYHNEAPGVEASRTNPIIVFANHTCYQRLVMFSFSAIQNVLPFRSSSAYQRNIYWLHWATKDLITFNDYKGHWPEFMSKVLVLPPTDICSEFGRAIEPIVHLSYNLERRNLNLRTTRDLLLPKLVSGEVSVENLEKEALAETV